MPKMKSVKSAVKRFKVKKNSIKRGAAYRSHLLTGKTQKRMRGLKGPKTVHSANMDLTLKQLCMR